MTGSRWCGQMPKVVLPFEMTISVYLAGKVLAISASTSRFTCAWSWTSSWKPLAARAAVPAKLSSSTL